MTNKPFLKAVAEDIYQRIGDDMSRTAVIFPGKRAGLFFNQYLADCASHPLWAPTYITISELFDKLSPLEIEAPIRQVCLLHEIFNRLTHRAESLDDFYYWGELLLSDFDDIDKNMVDTDRLFVNLSDIKALSSQFDFLTEEQKQVLQRFFGNFRGEEQRTQLKQQFLELWQVMGPVYHELRATLKKQGLAYEGMMYREVIEDFHPEALTYDHYVVVGFNVLNKVEKALFAKLKESGKAHFYWDYDTYYYNNPKHEAGVFLRENIVEFGNALDGVAIYDNLSHLPEITCISAPTDNAQTRYLHNWLSQYHTIEHEQETAVVLCNEDVALSALHALPSNKVKNVNITMGFKLTQTPIYTLINSYLILHTKGYDEERDMYMLNNVVQLLSHPHIGSLYAEAAEWKHTLQQANRLYLPQSMLTTHPVLGTLFIHHSDVADWLDAVGNLIDQTSRLFYYRPDDGDQYMQLYKEALFRCRSLVENFRMMVTNGTLKVKSGTLIRLMQRVMKQTTIPFHGEPAIGLQVMGVLETRNLDFEHIILLSTNEGKLPKSGNEVSFIPYNLREAFGMTTIKRQDAVYAYYFYRMIQRASHVTIVYNDGTDGINRQEPSRYIMQLKVEFPGILHHHSMQAASQPGASNDIRIEQSPESVRKLQEYFGYDDRRKRNYKLSASAINDYLDCRLRFYLKYIEQLTPPQDTNPDVDVADFGTLFHKSAELAYRKLTERNSLIRRADLEALYGKEEQVAALVDEAFRTEFFHTAADEPLPYNGTQLIVRHAICRYLHQLLRIDAARAPFTYVESEKRVSVIRTITSHGRDLPILLGGTIDRIDSKEGVTRIIDYKTGGQQKNVKSVADLFNREKSRDGYVLQAFYYAHLMLHEYQCIAPSLLFVRKTANENFEPDIVINSEVVNDFSRYNDDFSAQLTDTINEIFNSNVPYTAAENKDACKYCKFTSLCRRKIENSFG